MKYYGDSPLTSRIEADWLSWQIVVIYRYMILGIIHLLAIIFYIYLLVSTLAAGQFLMFAIVFVIGGIILGLTSS